VPEYKQARPERRVGRVAGRDELVGTRMAKRQVYCDGSSLGNGKFGAAAGMGVWWGNYTGAP